MHFKLKQLLIGKVLQLLNPLSAKSEERLDERSKVG